MNNNSSRTHCLVCLKLLSISGESFHENTLSLVDLAGTERMSKVNMSNKDPEHLNMIMTNVSLTTMTRVIHNISLLPKPIKAGDALPAGTQWKETAITRIIKSSFNGLALTAFIINVSQIEDNGSETWCAMNFGQRTSKLKTDVSKPPSTTVKKFIKMIKR
mmetsp:Transcript_4879/g.8360  ORF Transcript_4879/g.8360 Transcript_4879/m.8360 type:complete len:161 (+) Transcript_4879:166-648(+)